MGLFHPACADGLRVTPSLIKRTACDRMLPAPLAPRVHTPRSTAARLRCECGFSWSTHYTSTRRWGCQAEVEATRDGGLASATQQLVIHRHAAPTCSAAVERLHASRWRRSWAKVPPPCSATAGLRTWPPLWRTPSHLVCPRHLPSPTHGRYKPVELEAVEEVVTDGRAGKQSSTARRDNRGVGWGSRGVGMAPPAPLAAAFLPATTDLEPNLLGCLVPKNFAKQIS